MAGIRTWYLGEEGAQRIYDAHTSMKASPDEYCPTCFKQGTYLWEGQRHECDCEMQLQLYKHYLHAGIGLTYQRLDWTDYDGADHHHVDELISYVDNPMYVLNGMGLFLSGPKGTGKTMMANLTLKEFVKKGRSCFATVFTNAIEMFTSGWHDKAEKKYFTRRFLNSEILLLDDVGKENRNRLSGSVLDNVLRQRTQAGRPTIVTTNLTEGELISSYGGGVMSLLREKSLDFMYFDGDDFRARANERTRAEAQRGEMRPLV